MDKNLEIEHLSLVYVTYQAFNIDYVLQKMGKGTKTLKCFIFSYNVQKPNRMNEHVKYKL